MATRNFRAFQAQLPPQQRRQLPPLSMLEEQVLEQLILEEIQLQRARTFGIIVGDDVLNQFLAAGAQSSGITLEQMPAALAAEGINYAAFREETREQMMLDQLSQREVVATIVVAPREMELCLERSTLNASQDLPMAPPAGGGIYSGRCSCWAFAWSIQYPGTSHLDSISKNADFGKQSGQVGRQISGS